MRAWGLCVLLGCVFWLPGQAIAQEPEAEAAFKLHLLSYNVWGLHGIAGGTARWRYQEIGKRLDEFGIVALQEMWHENTEAIVEVSQFPYVVRSDFCHRTLWGSGLVTLSRYPVVEFQTLFYNSCIGNDCLARKAALFTRHQMPDGRFLDVYNTHLNAGLFVGNWNAGDEIKLNQLAKLHKWIKARSVAEDVDYLVVGDMNIHEGTELYSKMADYLNGIDLLRVHLPGSALFTYDDERNDWIVPSEDPLHISQTRLDYIWLGAGPSEISTASAGLAFHYPVKVPESVRAEFDPTNPLPSFRPLSDHFGVRVKLNFYPRL